MKLAGQCLSVAVVIWMCHVYTEAAALGLLNIDISTLTPPIETSTAISYPNTSPTWSQSPTTALPPTKPNGRPEAPTVKPTPIRPNGRPETPPIKPIKPTPIGLPGLKPCRVLTTTSTRGFSASTAFMISSTSTFSTTSMDSSAYATFSTQLPCYKLTTRRPKPNPNTIFDKYAERYPTGTVSRSPTNWLTFIAKKHILPGFISDIENIMNATQVFDISDMTEDVIKRIAIGVAELPLELQYKLFEDGGFVNMTAVELISMPAELIAYQTKTMAMLNMSLTVNQTVGVCQALTNVSTSPNYLLEALQNGVECDSIINRLDTTITISTPQAVTLLNKVKETDQPAEWTQDRFTDIIVHVGNALMQQDIESVPDNIVYKCLTNVTRSGISTMSTRRSLVKKLMKQYTSPTTWSNSFLVSMAPLLEDIDLDELKLLRNDAVLAVADELTEANIQKDTTRIVLAKSMIRTMTAAPGPEVIRKVLPWLKSDFTFMKNLDLDNLLEALLDLEEDFGMPETYMIAERLENHDAFKSAVLSNDSTDVLQIFGRLFEGFSLSYLDDLPLETLNEILYFVKPISSRVKARHIYRKILFAADVDNPMIDIGEKMCLFFNGMTMEEIDQINELTMLNCMTNRKYMPYIKQIDFPDHIGRKLVNKIMLSVAFESIDELIHLLGKLTRHVSTAFLKETRLFPLDQDIAKLDNTYMTKAQMYAVMNIVWKNLQNAHTSNPIIMSELVRRLGIYVLGLTAEDIISNFTPDSDFLSVIEMMSIYEDKLDSSQVQAIVTKLREYLQISERNVLDDVDEVTILQIGKFLQYLNSDYELVKFPKHLRPLIAQEMGKSSLMRIPTGKRRALLKFALKNAKADNDGGLKDIFTQPSIDADDLLDLGSLKCGLTLDLINKLTADAIKVHMEDLQKCPFKQQEMNAVTTRALYYNRNILISREHLAAMGHLMLELTDEDLNLISNVELAAIPEYIVNTINEHDVQTETIKKNGFIRELTAQDEEERNTKLKRLSEALRASMTKTFGSSAECQIVFRLQQTNVDISELLEPAKLHRCIEYIGGLKWDPITANHLLNRLGDLMQTFGIQADDTEERFEFLLQYAPNLLPGLPAEDFNNFNLTDDNVVATVGEVEMLTDEQIENGFNRWSEHRELAEVSGEQLAKLKYLACGASADYIRSHVDASSLRNSLQTLGQVVRKCKGEQLHAYADKVATALGGTSDTWYLGDLVEMGHLLGGLNEEHLSSLTEWQIKAIEPEVITNMPKEKILNFTIEQLGNMTVNQVSAMTSMQRSYLSEEQLDAVGIHFTYNGGRIPLASCYVTVAMVLSTVRHVFVFVFL